MRLWYVYEKFNAAVLALAQSELPLRERLANAYTNHLMHLEWDGTPDFLTVRFEEMRAQFDAGSAGGNEGSALDAMKRLDVSSAQELAASIVAMHEDVCRHMSHDP